jgi:hypothetical protein
VPDAVIKSNVAVGIVDVACLNCVPYTFLATFPALIVSGIGLLVNRR